MEDTILKVVSRYIVPVMQLYGVYIIFFGLDSPGGGFAGGSVLGVGMVVYSLVYGIDRAKRRVPRDLAMTGGITLCLTVVGELSFGGVFKIGIGLIVALVMLAIFFTLVEEV